MSFELETAANRESLRRVAIDPVSRVEGHGKVTLLLDEAGHVREARLHIVEFRGFEKFIQGRPYWEVPVMVQRLCGICPVSHHLAAAKALDPVVGALTITPTAEKIRRLMHYGQVLQSHALHFFHLSSPDLLFGFESPVQQRNIVGVAGAYPEVARQGVLLRKFGQGRRIDELVTTINRAAEAAVPMGKDLLVGAVQSMTVTDAKNILTGGDTSVTRFFADKTREPLGVRFLPVVDQATEKVGLTQQYNSFAGRAANFGLMKKEDANLAQYVTGKTLDGLYFMIGEEERKIRQNPAGAGSAILQKVFGSLK